VKAILKRFFQGVVNLARAPLPPWSNRRTPWAVIFFLGCFVASFVFWAMFHVPAVPQGLAAIKAEGRLVVLTRESPTTYYFGTQGLTGFEYLLTQALASSLGVKAEYRTYDTADELLAALRAKKGQLLAAGLLVSDKEDGLAESPGYESARDVVVCRRDGKLPKSLKEMAGLKVWVSAGTDAANLLDAAQSKVDGLQVQDVNQPVEVLLSAVAGGTLDCTTATSLELKVSNPYYPDLVEAFPLGPDDQLKWLFAPGSDDLAKYVKTWMAGMKKSGKLAEYARRFFGFLPPFDYVDTRAFKRAVENILPDYEKSMRDAARDTGLSWTLIAAISYQESHWNPDAVSSTGVKGMMMLTESTAKSLGVDDRTDPIASIRAGAKYIADLKSRIPEAVPEPDRVWFALVAYNMGFAHLMDARAQAERLGLDKNRWTDLRRALSVMDKPGYVGRLKYGRANAGQALRFVQQVRTYQHILDGNG